MALLGSTEDLEKMRKKDEYKREQRRLMVEEARSLARIRATKRLKLLSGLGGNGSPAPTVRNNLLWKQHYCMMHRPFERIKLNNAIANVVSDVWGISTLRKGFQDEAIVDIVSLRYQSHLIVQKTGGGKSAIFQCAGTMLGVDGGVTVVVEPIHMVACDQVERTNCPDKGVVAVYIDVLSSDEANKLDAWLFKKEKKESIFLFVSPQSLSPECKFGGSLIKRLCRSKLLRLVVVDEVHMVSTTYKSFRPHFADLKQNLFHHAVMNKVPIVAMTATMTSELLHIFYEHSGIEKFQNVLWGDISRRDVEIMSCTKPVPTHIMKAIVGNHLTEREGSRAIIYSNEKHYAMVNAKNAITNVLDNKNIAGNVVSVHGDTTLVLKQWAAKQFCNQMGEDTTAFPIRVLTATESAECGIDSPDCSLCICIGPPPSLASLSQRLGRVGRNLTRQKCDKFVIVSSVPTFNFLVRRAQKHKCIVERERQMKEMLQVMRFLIIQDECMHVKLEKIFSEPGTYDGQDHHPCKTECPFCNRSFSVHPLSRENLVHTLNSLFANGATSTEKAVNAIFSAKKYIWNHLTEAQIKEIKFETAHTILLQLIATEVVEYVVCVKNNDRSDIRNIQVNIGWCRKTIHGGQIAIPTYGDDENWKAINVYMRSSSMKDQNEDEENANTAECDNDSSITNARMKKRQRCTSGGNINTSSSMIR